MAGQRFSLAGSTQVLPGTGRGPAQLVEGHRRVGLTVKAGAGFGAGLPVELYVHLRVPLHHPSDGPPLPVGEE